MAKIARALADVVMCKNSKSWCLYAAFYDQEGAGQRESSPEFLQGSAFSFVFFGFSRASQCTPRLAKRVEKGGVKSRKHDVMPQESLDFLLFALPVCLTLALKAPPPLFCEATLEPPSWKQKSERVPLQSKERKALCPLFFRPCLSHFGRPELVREKTHRKP